MSDGCSCHRIQCNCHWRPKALDRGRATDGAWYVAAMFAVCPPLGRRRAALRPLVFAVFLVLAWAVPATASAYPWMIRHEYSACATCHTDPSGGGLLTRYGRAQSALLLSSRAGLPQNEEEPGKYKDFAFGAVPLPEELDLQGWTRSAYLINMSGGDVVDKRFLLMRGDLGAHVRLGAFRASGMLGVALKDSRPLSQEAWVTSSRTGANLVSREHWAGVALADDAVLVRAGRLNLPFGLRNIEHTTWVRRETRSDTNQQQQHGVAVAYTGEKLRGELMGIAGNFQVRPDAYRERGYAGYGEYAVLNNLGLGVSSSLVHANADLGTRVPYFRQAHGVFVRYAPVKPLVLMAEGDLLIKSLKNDNPATDFAGLLQADFEAIQGLHFVATGEALTQSRVKETLFGGWIGAWFFLFAHMDARIDLVQRTAGAGPSTTSVLFQLHGWL